MREWKRRNFDCFMKLWMLERKRKEYVHFTQDDFSVHEYLSRARQESYVSILLPLDKHAEIPKGTGLRGLIKNGRQFSRKKK